MGMLIDGTWQVDGSFGSDGDGRFDRKPATYRNWVTADGAAGPTGEGGFQAQAGRYHLYVSHACPWAHRTMIMRALKGLETAISVSVVNCFMGEDGWSFAAGDGVIGDSVNGADFLHQVYTAADPKFTGRVTVPVLWDLERATIVSNESSEIIRMFNSAFGGSASEAGDYYPQPLRDEVDQVNARVYETLNNGVYACGFATTQAAYDQAIHPLFDTLAWLEERLSARRYLTGATLTEADIRLFTTLLRFDAVYHGHFKCNLYRLSDYYNLWGFTREIYQLPKVRQTIHMDHIKQHYYASHKLVNPSGIVPAGPIIDFDAPHKRDEHRGYRKSA